MAEQNKHLKRAYRRWFEDGITELTLGVVVLLYSLYLYVAPQLGTWATSNVIAPLIMVPVFLVAYVVIRYTTRRLKERVSYPRTGYVAFRRPPSSYSRGKVFLLALLSIPFSIPLAIATAALLLGLLQLVRINFSYLVLAAMLAFGLWQLNRRTGLLRFNLMAGLLLLLGVALSLTLSGGMAGLLLLYGGVGLMLCVSGTIALVIFLRQYRPVDAEEDAA